MIQHQHKINSDVCGQPLTKQRQMVYEQPLNEKTRSFLRLEFLFEQARAHTFRHSSWDSRAALNALFDILNVFSRSDIKTELMKELERQASFLDRLTENPQVDRSRLDEVLGEMDILIDRLYAMHNNSLDLRNNEFLSAIRQRSAIAGGCCDFDLPTYHYWLSQAEEKRILDLQAWLEPFDPIHQATTLVLRLIRDSGEASEEIAEAGFYQRSLDSSNSCQLLRVNLPDDSPFFPEISGGKHRFTIRFMEHSILERPQQSKENIPFTLTCCTL